MRKLFALILLLFCFTGRPQSHSPNLSKTSVHHHSDEPRLLFNWYTFLDAFAAKLSITRDQANAFFSYAQNHGLVDMKDYFSKIRSGVITKDNALHYWLTKIPDHELSYKTKYLPYLESKKTEPSSNKIASPNAPQSGCNNLDFSNHTANWAGQWSDQPSSGGIGAYGPLDVSGINSDGNFNATNYVHEVCTAGTDRDVPISRVPPGHTYALRLGNDSAYQMNLLQSCSGCTSQSFPYNHQIIKNTFTVTNANRVITYWYAVALSQGITDPSVPGSGPHPPSIQPYFSIRMYDQSGNPINCAGYDVNVTTSASIGGFQSVIDPTGHNEFVYKDWSSVTIPLLSYIGQNVTIEFETSDCSYGGHFGYAYFAVDCAPFPGLTFTPFVCGMTSTTITAPPGLASYSWSGPHISGSSTGQTVTITNGGHYTVNMTTLGNNGTCTLSLDTVIPSIPATPATTFTSLPVCVGNPTVFGGVTTGVYNYLMWDFGDGTKDSSNVTPTHTYAAPGTYTVSLTLSNGCPGTHTAVVTVYAGASASFNAAPVCRGTPTVFNNTSTGGSSYAWNFGDGSSSTQQDPTHTYASAGVFAVTLTVTNTPGCKFVYKDSVTVNTMPSAQFSVSPACLGTTTTIYNTSTPTTNATYSWDFGNSTGSASNATTLNCLYSSVGIYTVSLTISTTAGCSASVSHTLQVSPIPSLTLAPLPPYCWNEQVPQTNYTVNPNSPTVTYSWNNSNPLVGLPGSGTGIPPAFVAGLNNTSSDIYGVVNVIPTYNGCVGPPASFTITIKPTPVVINPSVDYCPKAVTNAITFNPTPSSSSVVWMNTTPGTNIGLSLTSGTTTLPGFNAADPGNTMLTDIISIQATYNGCVGPVSTFSMNINPNPIASFTNSPSCDGSGTTFFDQSTIGAGNITAWGWDFNNDQVYTDAMNQNPSYILSPVGYHTVNLMVTSNKGCKDSVSKQVYVSPRPTVSFKGDTLKGCNPLTVHFTDSCFVPLPDSVVKWIWDFGNGATLIDTIGGTATETYTNSSHVSPFTYPVSLTAITSAGCATKVIKNNYITIYPVPLAAFSWGPTDADMLNPMVSFHDESQGANYYHWDFGDVYNTYFDNDTSNQQNPQHLYSDQLPYTYYATQIVTNIYGCKDTVVEPVIIKPVVTFYIPNAFSPNYNGINDGFKGTGIGIDLSTYNLWIFDRWGNEIFHSQDLEESWDGKFHGVLCQEDTYVWKVSFKDIVKQDHHYKGVVNIIR
ncbi:MAG: PKD domain-containing protein [Bacteroidia bacterium]